MRAEQRLIYIADDGKEFNTEAACKSYEKERDFIYKVVPYVDCCYCSFEDRMSIARSIAAVFPELIEEYNKL